MHAVKYNHLRHHKHCLSDEDAEGKCARMPALKALSYGPVFIFTQHRAALCSGNRSIVRDVVAELAGIAAFISIVFMLDIHWLQYHIIIMAAGECFAAFFAVWTVHHDCDEEVFARTQRSWWKNFFTYQMFYHLEHHLFPKYPPVNCPNWPGVSTQHCPTCRKRKCFK